MNNQLQNAVIPGKKKSPERWRPVGMDGTLQIAGGSEVFYTTTEDRGYFRAIGYAGKSAKKAWHFRFPTEAGMRAYIHDFEERMARRAAYAAAQREERSKPHSLAVGDVLMASWGYDQTHIDYYQVTRVTRRQVWVRPILQEKHEAESMQGDCVPLPGQFSQRGGETRHTVCANNRVHIDSVRSASRVDPKIIGGVTIWPVAHWTAYH